MTHLKGKCKCGHELHTINLNWIMFIVGVIIGACLLGKPWGMYAQMKHIKAGAPYYYKESMKARGSYEQGN